MALRDTVAAYLADPSPERLAALRADVRASANFEDALTARREAAELLASGRAAEARALLEGLMPGAFFSPSVHGLLGEAHRALGDRVAHEREAEFARAAVESVVTTGDGTAERPWTVLRVADEYDVVAALGRQPVGQAAVARGAGFLDRIDHPDGAATWFAVEA